MENGNINLFQQVLIVLERIENYVLELRNRGGEVNETKLLDNQDLCMYLKVSKRTLQRYRTSGKLPFHRIGQKTYYLEADVKEFLSMHFNKNDL